MLYVFIGIPLLLYILFYAFIIFVFVKNDKSAGSPIFSGPIISDTLQQPLENNFGHDTTVMEVVEGMDLTNRVIVMTGGHTGTGLQAAKAFVSKGANVIALAPDIIWAKKNLKGLPNIKIEYLDLLKPKSIDAFVEKFLKSNVHIDVLVNSAGIHNTPYLRDTRGYEHQFAVNVLGHFELSLKLLPALKKAKGARIVNLSSRGHRMSDVNLADINYEYTSYDGFQAYCQSKTAVSLITVRQNELFKKYNIQSFSVHPGPVPSSDLFAGSLVGYAHGFKIWMTKLTGQILRTCYGTELLNFFRKPKNEGDIYKKVQQGGATTVWAAVSQALNGKGGQYLEDCNIAQLVPNGSDAPFGVRPWALDRNTADRLWSICEKMTGVYFAQ